MTTLLNRSLFFIKEHVGIFKAANNFDVFDPSTNQKIIECREEKLGFFTKLLRFTKYKKMTSFNFDIKTLEGIKFLNVSRPFSFFTSNITISNEHGQKIGRIQQKIFSWKLFKVYDAHDQEIFSIKGKWNLWDFKILRGEELLAKVSKKWMGLGKELFTSADNYMLEILDVVPFDSDMRKLILATVLSIDMVLKE